MPRRPHPGTQHQAPLRGLNNINGLAFFRPPTLAPILGCRREGVLRMRLSRRGRGHKRQSPPMRNLSRYVAPLRACCRACCANGELGLLCVRLERDCFPYSKAQNISRSEWEVWLARVLLNLLQGLTRAEARGSPQISEQPEPKFTHIVQRSPVLQTCMSGNDQFKWSSMTPVGSSNNLADEKRRCWARNTGPGSALFSEQAPES